MDITVEQVAYSVTALAGIGAAFVWVQNQATARAKELGEIRDRLTRLETKYEVVIGFQVRRGALEAESKGLATQNSPLKVSDRLRTPLEPLRKDLESFWANGGSRMREVDAIAEIERRWGNQLVTLVCKPLGLHEGACWLAAYSVASGEKVLKLKLLGEQQNGTTPK